MASPSTVNQTAKTVADVLSQVIEGKGEDAVVSLILADTPQILAIPVLGGMWTAFVKAIVAKIGTYFFTAAAQASTQVIIDIQVNGEASKAKEAFDILQMATASGDQYAVKKASQDLDAAYGSLIHYDGSYTPKP